MGIAWVWALRAIRLLRIVAHRWLPEEYPELVEYALADVSNGTAAEIPQQESSSSSKIPSSPPNMPDHNQSWDDLVQEHTFDPLLWPEGDLFFQSGLSFFNLDRWPEF